MTAARTLRQRGLRLRRGLRGLAARVHRFFRPSGSVPRVLFYAADDLADLYLRRVGRAVAGVEHDAWLATPRDRDTGTWPVRRTSARLAPYRSWDLVVLANHAPLVFPRGTALLGVLHGIVRSRPVGQGSYWYAPTRMVEADGSPVFNRLLDASEVSRTEGEEFVPQVKGSIRVVGDLRADDVLHAASSAPPRDQVLVMSTWGPEALVPRHLHALAEPLASAAAELGLSVVVTSHPNLWRPQPHRSQRDHTEDLLGLEALGFTVLAPDDDWAPWLASSKIVLCDHTSLAANFALLDRPMLPVEVPVPMIGAGTFTECLYRHVDPWTEGQDLAARLREALAGGLPAPVRDAAAVRCDHLGHADARVAEAFAELLAELGGRAQVSA